MLMQDHFFAFNRGFLLLFHDTIFIRESDNYRLTASNIRLL